jgi:hypothetical protein
MYNLVSRRVLECVVDTRSTLHLQQRNINVERVGSWNQFHSCLYGYLYCKTLSKGNKVVMVILR